MRPALSGLVLCLALLHGQIASAADDVVPASTDAYLALLPVSDDMYGAAPKVVNGLTTSGFPTVGLLLGPGLGVCSGTLIGCRTFLTAAHCVQNSLDPANYLVFFQHNLPSAISAISVNPSYSGMGGGHDLAILTLADPVNGLSPTKINTFSRPPFQTPGAVAGFGREGDPFQATGIKRFGEVTTASCSTVSNSNHICWRFRAPFGPPGTNSSTCQGDSGGPLFIGVTSGLVLAGVTSGGNLSCLPPNDPWDSDVFVDRSWIQSTAGADLNNTTCGALPPAGSPLAPILGAMGTLRPSNVEDTYTFEVPSGTSVLGLTLNGDLGSTDFDLYAAPGTGLDPSTAPCQGESLLSLEACFFSSPTPGTWTLQANRFSGTGQYQLTVTLFGPTGGAGPCVPSSTRLCISDQTGDRRFSAEVAWNRPGALGQAGAIDLSDRGVRRGGLFWIGNPSNPEILLKVLNGCAINDHYWVFYSAGTNQGLDLVVRDTVTGNVWTGTNPNGTLAPPVADLTAFPCE